MMNYERVSQFIFDGCLAKSFIPKLKAFIDYTCNGQEILTAAMYPP